MSGILTQSYQHLGGFVESDKVWYQPLSGNSWLGQSVWLHTHGNIKTVVVCQVKPFELVDRKMLKNESKESTKKRQVMLEDGLEDVKNLDIDKDVIGANYLRMGSSMSFSELCSFVVELPISEY